eukprot:6210044-Amphidinium_carterae.1
MSSRLALSINELALFSIPDAERTTGKNSTPEHTMVIHCGCSCAKRSTISYFTNRLKPYLWDGLGSFYPRKCH